jgi:hypothetical protein
VNVVRRGLNLDKSALQRFQRTKPLFQDIGQLLSRPKIGLRKDLLLPLDSVSRIQGAADDLSANCEDINAKETHLSIRC